MPLQIEKLVFYFNVKCVLCKNILHISHPVIESQQGNLVCTLCGKPVKVPDYERFVKAAEEMNKYLAENAQHVTLTMNPEFVVESSTPAAAH